MRLLLDTHAFLWWRDESPRLPAPIGERISDPENDILISIVSLWEITVKRGLGKLRFDEDFEEVMAQEGFSLLTVSYAHLRALGSLPRLHRDPFDRLLIAQAIADNLPMATNDRDMTRYAVKTVW
ncbi:MAG TPA: type II toxin-antitoxin system VapC family toxin [Stellaceae bacterium]|nr:type II toxin-antitoxin system VapC family toxin [Stellaceae bacterium]